MILFWEVVGASQPEISIAGVTLQSISWNSFLIGNPLPGEITAFLLEKGGDPGTVILNKNCKEMQVDIDMMT